MLKEIIACHHENGTIQKVKLNDGSIITINDVIVMAKEQKIKNFTVSKDKKGKYVLRGKRQSLPNTRLYDLPRF